jgi:nitrate/nitrite-specific signal transduction histidine kinase
MKKNWWSSLQVKIVAWSFVPTVIILSGVAWFTFYSYQKVIGDLAIKQDVEILNTKVIQAADGINNLINPSLQAIILNIDTKPELSIEVRAQNILDRTPNLTVFDGGIYFVDEHGIVFKSQPEQPELIGQDWSDTSQFRYVRDNPPGGGPITNIQSIGTDEAGIVCVIWPMHNTLSKFVGAGYYCLAINPNEQNILYTTANGLSLGQNVYILDGNQHIIFSPDLSQLGRDISTEASIQQLLQSESKSIRFHNGQEDKVISYSSLVRNKDPNIYWILVSEKRWNEIMQPTLPYQRLLLVLLALGAIVPVLVTAYGVRHITNPIQKLIHAAEQVTAGQFKHRIEVKTGDEIETLADQFNFMSAELDESYASLEKKVADRTHELAILNSIISVASHSLNIEDILGDALNKTVEQMDFEAGSAFIFKSDPAATLLMAHQGFEPAAAVDLVNRYATTSQRSPVYPKEVAILGIEEFQDEKLKNDLSQLGFQLLVYIPLSTKGRELGFFILGKREPGKLSPEELALLSSVGKQIGVAMENAHLYQQAEQTGITAERSRLARELHDAVTQTLFSANLIADVIPSIWKRNPDEGMKNLEELRQLTRGALAEMRTMLLEMRPESLERSDIKSLLTQLADAFIGRVRVPVSLAIQGGCELTHEVKIVFYRVAQEALNNIAKHSGARQVELHLECQPGQMTMLIKDDGLGFDTDSIKPGHLGIAIMRERANSIGAGFKIESQSGQGTTVELDWKSTRKD